MFEKFSGKQVLLLQGPVGPFFHWLAKALSERDVQVTKVNFNAADSWYFSAAPSLAFRGRREQWAEYLRASVKRLKIDAIFLFGDSRPYHVAARQVAQELGLKIYAFEEGYLRPDYITFEQHGTNFLSRIPKDPAFFLEQPLARSPAPTSVGQTFWVIAWYASVYATVLSLFSWRYPHYCHHRNWNALRQAGIWWLSAGRKISNGLREQGLLRKILRRSGHYFLVPLQVHDDYQIRNSHFASVPAFIEEVVSSFAQHAPAEAFLVLKHHPRDRGFCDYRQLLLALARRHDLVGRIYYIHDLHLPTLLSHARGSVVVNSTVGLSSLLHNTPVKCLDESVYAAATSQQNLLHFWQRPEPVNAKLVAHLIGWLKTNVLINGSFYRPRFWRPSPSQQVEEAVTLSKRDVSSHSV